MHNNHKEEKNKAENPQNLFSKQFGSLPCCGLEMAVGTKPMSCLP